MRENNFVGYEYQSVKVKRPMVPVYADGYVNFGWELEVTEEDSINLLTGKLTTGVVTMNFKRDRKIRNKVELTRLQRNFDACANEILSMESSKRVMPSTDSTMTLGEVKRRIEGLTAEFDQLLEQDADNDAANRRFAEIAKEMAELKRQQERIAAQLRNNEVAQEHVRKIEAVLDQEDHHLTQWDEEMIRQLVHTVKVISAYHIRVYLNDGTEIDQEINP